MHQDASFSKCLYPNEIKRYGKIRAFFREGILAGLLALVPILVRVPAAAHQCGGQDEDYFTIAGWTLRTEGRPRIPYVPSRDEQGVFFRADEILFALPPGFFMAEAGVFSLVGPSYWAGRLTSLLAGWASLMVVFGLARQALPGGPARVGMLAYGFSRGFFFPASTARPDMLADFFLFAAVGLLGMFPRHWWAAGFCCGLALATHPFALVGTLLSSAWLFVHQTGWNRLVIPLVFLLLASVSGLAIWLPWIVIDPGLFWIQFNNNVLSRAGPGLLGRFMSPWNSLAYQSRIVWELCGSIQTLLYLAGLFGGLFLATRWAKTRPLLFWAWGSSILLIILQGEHPTKGYWSFPLAFSMLLLAGLIGETRQTRWFWVGALFVLLIPGSGVRSNGTYLIHWGSPEYHHPTAVHNLINQLPKNRKYLVDVGCVLDFHLAGRDVTLALNIKPFFVAEQLPFDYLIVTRTGKEQQLPKQLETAGPPTVVGAWEPDLKWYAEVWKRKSANKNEP